MLTAKRKKDVSDDSKHKNQRCSVGFRSGAVNGINSLIFTDLPPNQSCRLVEDIGPYLMKSVIVCSETFTALAMLSLFFLPQANPD